MSQCYESKMSLEEIDKEINRLKVLRDELMINKIEDFKNNANQNVGRCFKVNGVYAKVIGIPKEERTLSGNIRFNQYQYPAIFLSDDSMPFYEDTLFSGAWGVGNNTLNVMYEEVSNDEFDFEFDKRLRDFSERIKHKKFEDNENKE